MTTQNGTQAATPPGIFQSIIAWGRQELQSIEGEAVTLWNTIEPELVSEAQSLIAQFLGTAITAVEQQAELVLSGQEKFANAKDIVLEAIETSGRTVGNTLLEFLVNLALSLVKLGGATSLL
ncbi:MAG: hypothetical protein ACREHF_07875 [Rhizomicrobium sp.]